MTGRLREYLGRSPNLPISTFTIYHENQALSCRQNHHLIKVMKSLGIVGIVIPNSFLFGDVHDLNVIDPGVIQWTKKNSWLVFKIGMIHGSQGWLIPSLPDCYPYHPNTVHLRRYDRYGWMSRVRRELKNPLPSLPNTSSEKVFGWYVFYGSSHDTSSLSFGVWRPWGLMGRSLVDWGPHPL